jgi:hypothetical protein
VVRGKPENFNRPDYNFRLDHGNEGEPDGDETVRISERKRGAPLDLIVSEAMILANSHWGGWLAEHGVPGIYRSQASLAPGIKVRMGTKPAPHAGMGVAQYTWATSPLRRYVDLVNQWQIIACARHGRTAALAAPFKPRDAALFSVISSVRCRLHRLQRLPARHRALLDPALAAAEQAVTELDAAVLKDGLVRADTLPLVFRALGCESAAAHPRARAHHRHRPADAGPACHVAGPQSEDDGDLQLPKTPTMATTTTAGRRAVGAGHRPDRRPTRAGAARPRLQAAPCGCAGNGCPWHACSCTALLVSLTLHGRCSRCASSTRRASTGCSADTPLEVILVNARGDERPRWRRPSPRPRWPVAATMAQGRATSPLPPCPGRTGQRARRSPQAHRAAAGPAAAVAGADPPRDGPAATARPAPRTGTPQSASRKSAAASC